MKISSSSQSVDRLFISGKMDIFDFINYARVGLALDAVVFEDKHITSTDNAYLEKISEACLKQKLEIANLAFFNSFGFPGKDENLAEVERAVKWMDVAVKLGCRNFRIFAGWMGGPDREIGFRGEILPKTPEAWEMMVECVNTVCERARERKLNVVIENHNHGGFLSVSDDVLRLFSQVRADNLSLLLDTGNFADGIQGIKNTIHLARRHIHLKCREIQENGSDSAFDLSGILAIVRSGKFTGNISIEYEGTQNELDVLPRLIKFVKAELAS